jgi:hypothetical protein
MKRITLLALGILLLAMACTEDKGSTNGTLKMVFKAHYDGEPIVLNTGEYEYFDGNLLKFAKLNLYVSHPTLVKDGFELELEDILFVDFGEANRTMGGAVDGVSYTWKLAAGVYDALDLGIGVSPDLNGKLPTDYPQSHPLNQSGQYWTPWNSFIFSKTEGRYDPDSDGTFDVGFVYHIGSDMMFRQKTEMDDFIINADEETVVEVNIDFKRVLGTPAEYVDIQDFPAFHSPQDPALAALTALLASNYEAAVQVTAK